MDTSQAPVRILVVDDDQGIRKVLTAYFSRQGFAVAAAEDGLEAQQVLGRQGVDLIISDVVMPRCNGLQLLEAIRATQPHVPMIMITGMPEVGAAVECMKHGAFDYITKPFDFGKIREVVDRALEEAAQAELNPPPPDLPPQLAGRYEIEGLLGEGNVGVVFLATRLADQRPVALKILKHGFVTPDERAVALQRFLTEAEITSAVRHPNILEILEYSISPDEPMSYLVMEYFESKALTYYIDYPDLLDTLQKTRILRQIADALAAVHDHDILHRDIKPHNVLVNKDLDIRLMDFGVAKNPNVSLTVQNEGIGSPAYIAPEGFSGGKVDHRADLFSLGVLAYELYLGVRPFRGETIAHFAHLIQHERPLEPRKIKPNFPRTLQTMLARMLRKDPDDRYDNARQIVEDFDQFIESGDARHSLLQTLTTRLAFDWR